MRFARTIRLVAVTLVIAMTPVHAGEPESGSFGTLVARFVTEYQERNPLFASRIGVYTYDDLLPDVSLSGRTAQRSWASAWRARFAASTHADDSLDIVADRSAVVDLLDAQEADEDVLDSYRTDPTMYVGILSSGMYELLTTSTESLDVRLGHLAKRLALVPGIVDAAMAQLDRPTRPLALLAIRRNRGAIDLYDRQIRAALSGAPDDRASAVRSALEPALVALHAFQAFLEGPLQARADRNPRIGVAAFDRFLALAGAATSRADLAKRARAQLALTRARMLEIAEPLDQQLFPGRAHAERGEARINVVVREVLDAVADSHASADSLLQSAREDVASLQAFVATSGVLVLPVPDTLVVRETPAFAAGLAGASFSAAGPFTPLSPAYFNIDPVPPGMPADRVTSYLREYNVYGMRMISLHEAMPGHYVQLRYNAESPSLVRKLFGNGAFAEGWACYTEGMMLDAGYGHGEPKLRLAQLKLRLREYINAIIDIEYHTENLSRDAAIALMVDAGFQERAEAEAKWTRLELSHNQLSTYYIGLDAIESAKAGSALSLAEFNMRLLRMGSVQPRWIAPLLHAPS